MLALLRQHPEPPAPLTSYPTVVSPSYGHGAPVPTTPTAKIAMVHPSTDAPSPSHKDSDRPFQCHEPGCGRRFNRKFTLSEHIKTHTGEKPYVCPVASCSKRFSTSGNLARHKRLHASIKPFECTVDSCKRSFPNELKLQQHLKIHLGGKTHMCKAPGCGKSFSTAGNLTRHMKNHHSGAASSSRPQDLNQYRTAMAPALHHHHSPVSVANSMYTSQHNRPQPSAMSAYAPMGAPPSQQVYHNPPPHLSQPSMANLYYSFNHTSTSAHEHIMNHGHSPQPHDHHHHHSVGAPASYHQGPYHAPVYDDMPNVHPLQPHDGASSLNLFDDVIEFQLGHPRMM